MGSRQESGLQGYMIHAYNSLFEVYIHDYGKNKDKMLRHPTNGVQLGKNDVKYKNFGKEARNVRFALSIEKMKPFGNMSTKNNTV